MKKRLFCAAVSMFLAAALFLQTAAAGFSQEDELTRAARLGLSLSLAGAENVSGQEYAALLDHFIQIAAPAEAEEWARVSARLHACTRPLNRSDGMAALACAAEIVGGESATVLPLSCALPTPAGAVAFRMDADMTEAWETGGTLWLAEYEESGRMTALQQAVPAGGTVVLFPREDTARVSLLCLDRDWKPLFPKIALGC